MEVNATDYPSTQKNGPATIIFTQSNITGMEEETITVSYNSGNLDKSVDSDPLFDQFSSLAHDIMAGYLFIIGFFSVSSNILCIVIYTKTKKLRTPLNMMCINLCVSDLVVAVFGTFCKFVFTVMDKPLQADTHLCNWYGFSTYIGGKIFPA